MSYESAQKTLQHKRKIQRRIEQLTDQILFLTVLRHDYLSKPFKSETERGIVLSRVDWIIQDLERAVKGYKRYQDYLKGDLNGVRY